MLRPLMLKTFTSVARPQRLVPVPTTAAVCANEELATLSQLGATPPPRRFASTRLSLNKPQWYVRSLDSKKRTLKYPYQ